MDFLVAGPERFWVRTSDRTLERDGSSVLLRRDNVLYRLEGEASLPEVVEGLALPSEAARSEPVPGSAWVYDADLDAVIPSHGGRGWVELVDAGLCEWASELADWHGPYGDPSAVLLACVTSVRGRGVDDQFSADVQSSFRVGFLFLEGPRSTDLNLALQWARGKAARVVLRIDSPDGSDYYSAGTIPLGDGYPDWR